MTITILINNVGRKTSKISQRIDGYKLNNVKFAEPGNVAQLGAFDG